MSNTAIMTDSNCGIMPEEGRNLGIHVLPMPVIIDGQTYYEGIDITLDEFFKGRPPAPTSRLLSPRPAMWKQCGQICSGLMTRFFSSPCPGD